MKITKAASVELSGAPSAEQLEKINRLTKKAVTAEEVYVFSVRLCDDQVDRDDERFSESCIRELAALFIGKTGVMDHVWSAEKQVARIFDTEVLAENGATYLKGWAYMLRGAETDGLIREIDGGIKKEVSIGCAVKRRMCSICGARAEQRVSDLTGGWQASGRCVWRGCKYLFLEGRTKNGNFF